MNNRKCCSGCPIANQPINASFDLDACIGSLADELLAARTSAEVVRSYLSRIIAKVDELLDVLDEADWDFTDEEDDE